MNNLKYAFFGTPEIASKTLEILKSYGYMPSIVITNPDSSSGRGLTMHESPVSLWAHENNIKVLKPEKINEKFLNELKTYDLDLSIVVAYGKIIPEVLITMPKLGTINIHYSLLPKYRGASPLEQALLHGDTKTGVAIQQMVYKLDGGAIIAQKEIEINIQDTKESLRGTLTKLGGELLVEILPNIINKEISPTQQDETQATICIKIKKEDSEIKLAEDQEIINYNKYRAFYGWPGVYFFKEKNDKKIRIKVTKANFENNKFIVERVIPEGKKEIDYIEFLKNYN